MIHSLNSQYNRGQIGECILFLVVIVARRVKVHYYYLEINQKVIWKLSLIVCYCQNYSKSEVLIYFGAKPYNFHFVATT